MSARKSASVVDSYLSNRQSPQGRIPVAGSDNILLMQRMEDFTVPQLWRLTNMLIKIPMGR